MERVSNSYWGIWVSMSSFRRSIEIISSLSPTQIQNVLILVISPHRSVIRTLDAAYGDHHVSRTCLADKTSSGRETFMLLWDEVGTALGNLSCSRGDHGIV